METPNTRSRRKREQQEGGSNSSQDAQDDGLSIRWEHDSYLRRAVMQATENDIIAPLTPTQKPRPISSRLSASPLTTSTPKTSSRPSRKRPCRNNRSAPTSSLHRGPGTPASLSPATPAAGLISLPDKIHSSSSASASASGGEGTGNKTRLEILLDEYEKLKMSTSSSSSCESLDDSLSSRRTPRKDLTATKSLSALDLPSTKSGGQAIERPATGKSTTQTPRKGPPKAQSLPHPNISAHRIRVKSPQDEKTLASPARASSRAPLSPIKTGPPPRLGLGSQHKPAANRNFARTSSGKLFKPPFKEPQQAVRSSPRRPPQPQNQTNSHPITMRAPAAASPKSIPTKRARPNMPHSRSSTVSTTDRSSSLDPVAKTPVHPRPFANFDVGENDPEGDTSFDSFDGMLESGGPEIEMLYKQMDGK